MTNDQVDIIFAVILSLEIVVVVVYLIKHRKEIWDDCVKSWKL